MTHDAATAYACVAYRVMEYDREPLTEEQFEVILESELCMKVTLNLFLAPSAARAA